MEFTLAIVLTIGLGVLIWAIARVLLTLRAGGYDHISRRRTDDVHTSIDPIDTALISRGPPSGRLRKQGQDFGSFEGGDASGGD